MEDPEDPTLPPFPRSVAVKVIHPNVKRQIELDLEMLRAAGTWARDLCVGLLQQGRAFPSAQMRMACRLLIHLMVLVIWVCGAAWLAERGGYLQWWSLREFVEEFAGIMNMQLDLRKEAVRTQPHHHHTCLSRL